jgi:hypothetical protein
MFRSILRDKVTKGAASIRDNVGEAGTNETKDTSGTDHNVLGKKDGTQSRSSDRRK